MNPSAAPPRLSDVLSYLRAPRYRATREALDAVALSHLARVLGFCFLAVVLASPLLGGIISGVMGEVPDNVLSEIEPREMVLYGIVLAPLIEELMFRSWMGGPRAALIGLPVLAGLLAVFSSAGTALAGFPQLLLAAVLIVLVVQLGVRVWRANEPQRRAVLARVFPIVFWGATLGFGVIHLSNYSDGLTHPVLLLAVLPQTLIGGVLGYVRMRYGLMAAIGFHALHNAVFIGLGLLAMGALEDGVAEEALRLLRL